MPSQSERQIAIESNERVRLLYGDGLFIFLYKTLESNSPDLAVMLNFCKPLDFL